MLVQFNKRSILPTSFDTKDGGKGFNATIFSPVKYQIRFGEGIMPVQQMKALLLECSENAQEVEIEFTEGQSKFGSYLEIYSVKPLHKKNP